MNLQPAITLLEDLDPNCHTCTCSGCTEAVDNYNKLLAMLRELAAKEDQ